MGAAASHPSLYGVLLAGVAEVVSTLNDYPRFTFRRDVKVRAWNVCSFRQDDRLPPLSRELRQLRFEVAVLKTWQWRESMWVATPITNQAAAMVFRL